ncbi:MAG: putative dienelactone hydrolase [Flavobacteriales bacterium]|jgi:predicted dienelactone hydrolase
MNIFKNSTLTRTSKLIAAVLICLGANAASASDVGSQAMQYTEVDLYDASRERPVKVSIWYPAGENCDAAICLNSSAKTSNNIVLSHGSMGSSRSLNWLGYAFASQGFVTVGLNHYGESWVYGQEHVDPKSAFELQDRPKDVSFVLDQLSSNQTTNKAFFNRTLNWDNTTIVGHSAGGATALLLAGAQMDIQQAFHYCKTDAAKTDKSCAYLDMMKGKAAGNKLSEKQTDKRITKLVLLDPAAGHVMTEESLKNITQASLIIASQKNDFLNFRQHAERYNKLLPHSALLTLNSGEGHFVYLDSCDHTHKAMGVSICKDREGVDRKAVQEGLYGRIFGFLYSGH